MRGGVPWQDSTLRFTAAATRSMKSSESILLSLPSGDNDCGVAPSELMQAPPPYLICRILLYSPPCAVFLLPFPPHTMPTYQHPYMQPA